MSEDAIDQGNVIGPITPTVRIDQRSIAGLWALSAHGTILEHNPNRLSGPATLLGVLRIGDQPDEPNVPNVLIHELRANLAGEHSTFTNISARSNVDGIGIGLLKLDLAVQRSDGTGSQLYEMDMDLTTVNGETQANGTVIANEVFLACNVNTTILAGRLRRVIS